MVKGMSKGFKKLPEERRNCLKNMINRGTTYFNKPEQAKRTF